MREGSPPGERGAVAVEFALMVPVLITLLFGIIEFGHIYNAQIVMTNAAREAARTMAVTNNSGQAVSAAQAVATEYAVTVDPGVCVPDQQVTATVTSQVPLLTGSWLGFGPVNLRGVGVMRCGG